MKKVALVIAVALALGGCTKQQLERFATAEAVVSTTIENPVTPERLYEAENGAIVVFAGLNTYKRLCLSKVIPKSCRGVITSIQVYTKQIEVQLPVLRKFVKENDQVNAVQVYNLVMDAIAKAKSTAELNKVPMGDV